MAVLNAVRNEIIHCILAVYQEANLVSEFFGYRTDIPRIN